MMYVGGIPEVSLKLHLLATVTKFKGGRVHNIIISTLPLPVFITLMNLYLTAT